MITKLPSLRFQSLRAFVEGTRDLLQDEACELARAERAALHAWIAATPAARKHYRSREIDKLVDYYWHLDLLLHHCETGSSPSHGYAAVLSEAAVKHWDQNARRHPHL